MEGTGRRAVVLLRRLRQKSTEGKGQDGMKQQDRHGTKKQAENLLKELSEYELGRLDNIRQNQAFLASMNLSQAKEELRLAVRPKRPVRVLRSTEREDLPQRKSQRLQGKVACILPLPPRRLIIKKDKKLPGPLPNIALNMEDGPRC